MSQNVSASTEKPKAAPYQPLYDERGIRDRIRALRNAIAWAPDFQEYFAVKALV